MSDLVYPRLSPWPRPCFATCPAVHVEWVSPAPGQRGGASSLPPRCYLDCIFCGSAARSHAPRPVHGKQSIFTHRVGRPLMRGIPTTFPVAGRPVPRSPRTRRHSRLSGRGRSWGCFPEAHDQQSFQHREGESKRAARANGAGGRCTAGASGWPLWGTQRLCGPRPTNAISLSVHPDSIIVCEPLQNPPAGQRRTRSPSSLRCQN